MKAKAMAWLLTWFMIAQITLISYHTEAFVKTEVACTVCIKNHETILQRCDLEDYLTYSCISLPVFLGGAVHYVNYSLGSNEISDITNRKIWIRNSNAQACFFFDKNRCVKTMPIKNKNVVILSAKFLLIS